MPPDGTPLGIPTQHTTADLRAIATLPTPQRHQFYVRALAAVFAWEPSSSETDDDQNIIRPTDRSSLGGRWVKVAVG